MLRPLWSNTYRNLGARERRLPWVALTSGNLVKRPELADSRLSHCNMIVQYSERPDPTRSGRSEHECSNVRFEGFTGPATEMLSMLCMPE